ncbi:MAG: N-acetylglucosamine-6-phosphate deacetylase [Lachnospiraceae bacterium]
MRIQNGLVFHKEYGFQREDLELEEGIIKGISSDLGTTKEQEILDASGCYVIPGLVDVHFHGCAGHDFCEGTQEAIQAIEQYELHHGITTICPATMTLSEERLTEICRAAAVYGGNCLKGIHLEGPFLSEAKKGAQNAAYLHAPDAGMVRRLKEASGDLVRLVSIAPELPGATECIVECASQVRFSVAHTQADYETALHAMQLGAMHVTHLYNAMPPFTHRAPGVIGAAFDSGADVELICDGIHIDPCVVRATFRLFTEEHVVLVSDSMMATGMADGAYELGGQPVDVRGNRATLADGTIAGSATNLYDCMMTAIRMGIDPVAAVRAATYNPAKSVGLEHVCGSICEEMPADLLIVDRDWKLKHVIKGGKRIA